MLVELYVHVVELDLYAIEQRVVIGRTWGDTVQRIDHFNDAVEDALGQHQRKVAGRCCKRGTHGSLLDSLFVAAPTAL